MRRVDFKRASILILIIVVGISSLLPAGLVLAQTVGVVPVNDLSNGAKLDNIGKAINGTTTGPFGTPIPGPVSAIGTIRGTLTQSCVAVINQATSAGAASFLQSLNATNLSIIGGSDTEAVLNSTQAKALTTAYNCVTTYVQKLTAATTDNLQEANNIQREQSTFSGIRDALGQRVDAMNARASASWKDVLRALLVKTAATVTKVEVTELMNKVQEKYKISDFLAYGDALASQVYSMKYISDNFSGDAQTQLMVRSLLQSDKLPDKVKTVQTMANSQVQSYVGQACNVANPNANSGDEMYFINCVKALGNPQASKDWRISQAIDGAQAASAAGKIGAGQEISQSNGYAPPRNCSGSIAQQQQIDTQTDAAALNLSNAQAALKKLKDGKAAASEIAKGQAAVDQAQANYNALFQKLQSGGGSIGDNGKAKTGAIIDICEGIASPASFVATSLSDFLKTHLDQASDLKSDNLPFFANFLSDVASNFLTNILTGGKSTTQVLKEGGVGALNGALIGLTQAANGATNPPTGTTPGTGTNPIGDPRITITTPGSTAKLSSVTAGGTYNLNLDFSEFADELPYRVSVTGLGEIPFGKQLSAQELQSKTVTLSFVAPAQTSQATINFYAHGTNGDTSDVPLGRGGWVLTVSVSQVRGATTTVPSDALSFRGPEVSFR